ncbi:MAG: HAD family hydrolase [Sulfobacillus sp.]
MGAPWITFDLDGTLLKNPYWRLHLAPWLKAQAALHRENWNHWWNLMAQEGDRRWHEGDWIGAYDWSDIIAKLFGLSLSVPSKVAWPTIADLTLPGVLWMLESLRLLPIKLGVVTNGLWANQGPYLQSLGWDELFETIVTTSPEAGCKPDPKVFNAFDGPILCHVGDRIYHDVLAAHRAHTMAILYQPRIVAEDRSDPLSPATVIPDRVIFQHWDLPAVIHSLL